VVVDLKGRTLYESIGKPGEQVIISDRKVPVANYCKDHPSVPSHEEICEELKRLIAHFENPIMVLYLFECHAETLDLTPYKKLVDGSKIFTKTLQASFIELGRRELGVMLRKNTSKKTSALQDARLTTALFLSRIQDKNFTLDCIAFSDCTLTGEAKKRKNYYKNRKRTPASAQEAQLQTMKTTAAA